MEFLHNNRKEEQDRIFLVIKGLALFFCTYPLFELFFSYPMTDSFSELNLQSLMTSFALILVVLCVCYSSPRANPRPNGLSGLKSRYFTSFV